MADKAFQVIEALRFYFDMDNVLIIMGINDKILDDYVNKHYGTGDKSDDKAADKYDRRRGERFLEKIFHWNYEIAYTGLNGLHMRSLKKVAPDKTDEIRQILSNIDYLSHRKWTKLLNRIEKKVSAEKGDYAIEKIVFSAVLKELYPEFEIFSRRFSHILDDLHGGQTEGYIAEKSVELIAKDMGYLDFPAQNYESLLKATTITKKMEL